MTFKDYREPVEEDLERSVVPVGLVERFESTRFVKSIFIAHAK